jgi:endo-1,4-beta-xylanase
MKKSMLLLLAVLATLTTIACSSVPEEKGLKDAMQGKFQMGAALNEEVILGADPASLEVLLQHFNSITAENCMKMGPIHPEEGKFDFSLADKFIELAQEHDMYTVGHCLVWHSQAPPWFFTDAEGKEVSREVLIDRMKEHIFTVAGRYRGKVDAWDVVNEAFEDDGSWRETPFYRIIGEEYMELAYKFAHEADPEAELLYNDYSMHHKGRREAVVKLIQSFKEKGIAIHGAGMQAHHGMDYPEFDEFEQSILAFWEAGVKVHITEMDITVLPNPNNRRGAEISDKAAYQEKMNPYVDGMPEEAEEAMNQRWVDFFRIHLKHQDKIERITTWGISDLHSWKNNWPMRGRTNYPLLFDREFKPKPAVEEIIKAAQE